MDVPQHNMTIKIKFGDSIKRLTASINGNNVDPSIAKLREKIVLAFNLSPSVNLVLTYTDVDGDTVMLDDDGDLRDAAINQRLNPLRINVQLRSQLPNAARASEPRTNGANATRRSPLDDSSCIGSSLEEVFSSSLDDDDDDVLKVLSMVTEILGENTPPIVKEFHTKWSTLTDIPQAAPTPNVHFLSENSSSPASGTNGTTPTASTNATKTTPASEKCIKPKIVQGFDKEWFLSAKDGTKSNAKNNCDKEWFPFGKHGKKPNNTNSCDMEWFPCTKDAEEKAASERQCKGKAFMQNSSASHKIPCCAPQPLPQPYKRHALHQYVNGNETQSGVNWQAYRKEDRYKSIGKDDHDLHSKIPIDLNGQNVDLQIPPRDFPMGGPKICSKLKSHFIQDVTIPHGTILTPSTQFTKVWRMRNNGSSLWPVGTKLMCVGGDQLTTVSFPLEIPVDGLPIGEEIDISVEICAPARTGWYISYWRLASPSGQKFGQIVGVIFQVRQPENYKQDATSTIDLDQPENSSHDSTDSEVTSSSYDSTDSEMSDVEDTSDSEPSVTITTSNDGTTLIETQVCVNEPETSTVNGPDTSITPTVSDPFIELALSNARDSSRSWLLRANAGSGRGQ